MSTPTIIDVTARAKWHPAEYLFWLAAFATIFLFPSRYLILTEIAWLGLFVISLDLILGYAGILSLGQAAFFGVGAYAAGLVAKHEHRQRAGAGARRRGLRRRRSSAS